MNIELHHPIRGIIVAMKWPDFYFYFYFFPQEIQVLANYQPLVYGLL